MNLVSAKMPNQFFGSPHKRNVNDSGVIITCNADGSVTIIGTASTSTGLWIDYIDNAPAHKYVLTGGTSKVYMYLGATTNRDTGSGRITDFIGGSRLYFGVYIESGTTYNSTIYPQVTDLTEEGSGITTVSGFKDKYPLPYYQYRTSTQIVLPTLNNAPVTVEPSAVLPPEIGVVDLGSLNYEYIDSWQNPAFRCYASQFPSDALNGYMQFVCTSAKYTLTPIETSWGSIPNWGNNVIGGIRSARGIVIRDDDYTDAQSFKTAMAGVLLFYKKAT